MTARSFDNAADRCAYLVFRLLNRELYSSSSRSYHEINTRNLEHSYQLVQQLFDRRYPQQYIGQLSSITWRFIYVDRTHGTITINGTRWNKHFTIVIRGIQTGSHDIEAACEILQMFDPSITAEAAGRISGVIAGTLSDPGFMHSLSQI